MLHKNLNGADIFLTRNSRPKNKVKVKNVRRSNPVKWKMKKRRKECQMSLRRSIFIHQEQNSFARIAFALIKEHWRVVIISKTS